jgi:hypothetical protein
MSCPSSARSWPPASQSLGSGPARRGRRLRIRADRPGPAARGRSRGSRSSAAAPSSAARRPARADQPPRSAAGRRPRPSPQRGLFPLDAELYARAAVRTGAFPFCGRPTRDRVATKVVVGLHASRSAGPRRYPLLSLVAASGLSSERQPDRECPNGALAGASDVGDLRVQPSVSVRCRRTGASRTRSVVGRPPVASCAKCCERGGRVGGSDAWRD